MARELGECTAKTLLTDEDLRLFRDGEEVSPRRKRCGWGIRRKNLIAERILPPKHFRVSCDSCTTTGPKGDPSSPYSAPTLRTRKPLHLKTQATGPKQKKSKLHNVHFRHPGLPYQAVDRSVCVLCVGLAAHRVSIFFFVYCFPLLKHPPSCPSSALPSAATPG